MRKLFLPPILAILLILPCAAQSVRDKTKEKTPAGSGKVKIFVPGTNLTDDPGKEASKDSDIQPFRTYLQTKNFLKEMTYQHNGEFESDVPEGVYNIVLRANWDEPLTYKRAVFYVSPNKTTKIRIANEQGQNEVCDKKLGRVMIPNDSFVDMNEYSLPEYSRFVVRKPYDLVVKYCRKQNHKNTTAYTFALLTYKNLTVTANKITIDKKRLIVEGYGDKDSKVELEIGECIRERTEIKLDLNKLKPPDFACKQRIKSDSKIETRK